MPRRALPKSAGARRKRGTTGLAKEDRIKKHNALVDLYVAKRHLSNLKEVSDSSSSDADSQEVVTSDDEAENELLKLRSMLGCRGTGSNGAAGASAGAGGLAKKRGAGDDDTAEPTLEDVLGVKSRKQRGADKSRRVGPNGALDEDDDDMLDEEHIGDEDDEDDMMDDEEEEWEIMEEGDEDMFASDGDDDDGAAASDEVDSNVDRAHISLDDDDLDDGANDDDRNRATFVNGSHANPALPADDLFLAKYINNILGKPDESALEASAELSLDASVAPAREFAPPSQSRNQKRPQNNNNNNNTNGPKERTVDDVNPNCQMQLSSKAKKSIKMLGASPSSFVDGLLLRAHKLILQQQQQSSSFSPPSSTDSSATTTQLESALIRLFSSYADATISARTWHNAREICLAYATHCVNHLFKAKDVIRRNDATLARQEQEQQQQQLKNKKNSATGAASKKNADDKELEEDDEEDEQKFRDRNFGNTRILVLLPMRNSAHRFVKDLCLLTGTDWDSFQHCSSFDSDFSEMDEVKDPTFHRRPLDFQRQFDGNINDTFCFGAKVDKEKAAKNLNKLKQLKQQTQQHQQRQQQQQDAGEGEEKKLLQKRSEFSLQVYVPFLDCDMIVASPLGLRKRLEKDGNLSVALSSIEVVVIDEAHVMLMQSWSHVDACLALLNKLPTTTTEGLNDMTRIYSWALDGQSRRHRQTLLISAFSHAAFPRTMRESCCNNSGRAVLARSISVGAVSATPVGLRQHFLRLRDVASVEQVDEARFNYFTKSWFPTKIQPLMEQNVRTILYVPSYFDFARLKAWLDDQHRGSVAVLCEHSTQKEQRQALGQFTDQERCLLLFTERFYYFRRYFVKQADAVFFYSPPLVDFFYSDVVSRLNVDSPHAQAHTLFCKYDLHELSRVVSGEKAQQMLTRPADSYMIVNK